jgi:tetratricopeptide (TPR) repeat protein
LWLLVGILCLGPVEADAQMIASARARADSAWDEGRFELAETLYEERLAEEPTDSRALHRLALLRAWADRYQESIALFDRLLIAIPSNFDAALDRARVLSWQSELEESRAAYTALLELQPESREAWLGLARVLSWEGRLDSAIVIYDRMLDSHPGDPEALAGLATMAAWDGRLEEAETRWRGALELHPDNVMLLTGLGRTLRWGGQPAAALQPLERALEIAPEDAEAAQEFRLARTSIAPRVGPSAVYESDSDGNRIATLRYEQTVWPSGRTAIHVKGYARTAGLAGTGISGEAYGGLVELQTRVAKGWEMNVGAGASGSNVSDQGPVLRLSARAATPGHHRVQASARFSREALYATLPLMQSNVRIEDWSLGARGTLAPGWRAEASVGLARFVGSSSNRRLAGFMNVSRRISPTLRAGVTVRAFGFEEDADEGYFDPSLYALTELQAGWAPSFGRWRLGLDIAPGVQKVTRGASTVGATVRTNASLAYEFGMGRLLRLHGGYHTTGLTSFSTGDADYHYVHVALTFGWTF